MTLWAVSVAAMIVELHGSRSSTSGMAWAGKNGRFVMGTIGRDVGRTSPARANVPPDTDVNSGSLIVIDYRSLYFKELGS